MQYRFKRNSILSDIAKKLHARSFLQTWMNVYISWSLEFKKRFENMTQPFLKPLKILFETPCLIDKIYLGLFLWKFFIPFFGRTKLHKKGSRNIYFFYFRKLSRKLGHFFCAGLIQSNILSVYYLALPRMGEVDRMT